MDVEKILRKTFSYAFLAASIYVLLLYVGVNASAPLAYKIAGENATSANYIGVIPIIIFALPIAVPLPILLSFEHFFASLVLLYTFLLVLTLKDGEVNAIKAMRRIKSEGVGAVLTNSFLSTSLLTAAALLAILALHTAQEEAGIPTGGLNFADKILEYVSVTYAPLAEEIGFRVSMIGLIAVMVFISYTPMFKEARADLKTVAAGFIYPNKLRAIVKKEVGQDRLKTWLWRAIVGSAAAFGLTHILYGQGWEVGKVSGATLAGFLLGYLYVKHGFPAAALSHWTFNYLSETIDLISTRYVEASYIFWGFLALGALTIVYLAVALLGRLGLGIKFQSERFP